MPVSAFLRFNLRAEQQVYFFQAQSLGQFTLLLHKDLMLQLEIEQSLSVLHMSFWKWLPLMLWTHLCSSPFLHFPLCLDPLNRYF